MRINNKQKVKFKIKKWPVIGNGKVVKSLKNIILKDNIPHALLFSGTSGIGKDLLVYNFVKTIQCKEKIRPCGECESCTRIDRRTHPDILSLEGKENLKIKEIRNLKHKLSLSASVSSYRICLLKGAENLTDEAANALLKILEEPWGKIIIILITEKHELLLPTIISRCILFELLPLKKEEVRSLILSQRKNINEDKLDKIVLKSNGKIKLVSNYLNDLSLLDKKDERVDDIINIVLRNNSISEKMAYADKIVRENKDNLNDVLDGWISFSREIMFYKLNISDNLPNFNGAKNIINSISYREIKNMITDLDKAKLLLSKNINKKLLLENLFLNL